MKPLQTCFVTLKNKPLIIWEDFNSNVYVADLIEVVYTLKMTSEVDHKRRKEQALWNYKTESKVVCSHTIFRMILERRKGETF